MFTTLILNFTRMYPTSVSSSPKIYESVVCTCSGAYMRAEIGKENLVVCLSEYLPIYVIIVLAFAATRREMALRSVLYNP